MKLKENWNKYCDEIAQTEKYWHLSSTNLGMKKILCKVLPEKIGITLDVGAGSLALRNLLLKRCEKYFSTDIRKLNIDFISDAKMLSVPDKSIDMVICSAVIEHVNEPSMVISEIYRVLKHNGKIVLTAPHIHHIHGEPDDYNRFTRFGIKYLLEKQGFSRIEIFPVGGMISYLSTIFSVLFMSLSSFIKPLLSISYLINKSFVHLNYYVDRMFDREKKLALGYVAVSVKEI